jgi:hypothetical protein
VTGEITVAGALNYEGAREWRPVRVAAARLSRHPRRRSRSCAPWLGHFTRLRRPVSKVASRRLLSQPSVSRADAVR